MFSSFFFSSRRRHTRSLCDWSSDVCSSDLIAFSACDLGIEDPDESTCDVLVLIKLEDDLVAVDDPVEIAPHFAAVEFLRSEERRVGKECRYRWSTYN